MKKELCLVALFSLLAVEFDYAQKQDDHFIVQGKEAVKINADGFHNLYKINADLYRSEQPEAKGMYQLEKLGIRTVIDLRNRHLDPYRSGNTKLILIHIPVRARKIFYNDIKLALQSIHNSVKPVLVHCLHGSDRTGCIIAAYRMAYENWSKEKAIKEFLDKDFGFHSNLYPNILSQLRSLNVELLKEDLGIPK